MKDFWFIFWRVCAVVFLISFLISLASCKTQTVVMPQKNDSVHIVERTKYDSIFIDRWHTIKEKGDTIVLRDSIFVTKYKYVNNTDTVCVRDSIPYKVEVVKEVRRRNTYDRVVSWGFWIMLGCALVIIGLRLYLRFKGIKK